MGKRAPNKITKKVKITYQGLTLTLEQWCARLHLSWKTVRARIHAKGGKYDDLDYILSQKDMRHERIDWNWKKDRPKSAPVQFGMSANGTLPGTTSSGGKNNGGNGSYGTSIHFLWETAINRGSAKCHITGRRVSDIWQCRTCPGRCVFSLQGD